MKTKISDKKLKINGTFFHLVIAFFSLVLSLMTSTSVQANPLGWERYSLSGSGISSGVFRDKSISHVYNNYAKPLTLVSVGHGIDDKRLIDVEVHVEGKKGDQEVRLSGVWIENSGEFKQESWLMVNVGWGELIQMHTHWEKEIIALDVERYKLNGKLRYAVIWQRNIHHSSWYLKTAGTNGVSLDAIRSDEADGFRVVDIDHFKVYDKNDYFQTNPVAENFDAILVENTGGNFLNSELIGLLPAAIDHDSDVIEGEGLFGLDQYVWFHSHYHQFMLPQGSLIVDIENINNDLFSVIWPWYGFSLAIVVHDVNNCINAVTMTGFSGSFETANLIPDSRIIDYENSDKLEPLEDPVSANAHGEAALLTCK